jgi:cold shock CspA family protein
MQVSPEIAFRNISADERFKEQILAGIDDLEEVYPDLVSCRAVVADDTPGQRTGSNIRVRLDIGIPNHEVVVVEDNPASDDTRSVKQTIRDAFQTARRSLKREKAQQRGDAEAHDLPPHGRITRLLTDDRGVHYGFIRDREGRQIYFHEDALVDLDFQALEVGDEVRIAVAAGDEGPQASTVAPLDREAIGPRQEAEVPLRSG